MMPYATLMAFHIAAATCHADDIFAKIFSLMHYFQLPLRHAITLSLPLRR
jgi:hypothetical protein